MKRRGDFRTTDIKVNPKSWKMHCRKLAMFEYKPTLFFFFSQTTALSEGICKAVPSFQMALGASLFRLWRADGCSAPLGAACTVPLYEVSGSMVRLSGQGTLLGEQCRLSFSPSPWLDALRPVL